MSSTSGGVLPAGETPQSGPSKALRPWIEVVLPHPDVIASRFKEAEFAADLFAVDAGHATEDYATAENFFRITFPTEGLKRVLTSTLQRLPGPRRPDLDRRSGRSFPRDPWASDAPFRQEHREIGCDRRGYRHPNALPRVAAALP